MLHDSYSAHKSPLALSARSCSTEARTHVQSQTKRQWKIQRQILRIRHGHINEHSEEIMGQHFTMTHNYYDDINI